MKGEVNSRHIQWFSEIERELGSFFRLFSFLCERCYLSSIEASNNHQRQDRSHWCCCLIDNQIHDNWPALDQIQRRFAVDWYQKLRRGQILPPKTRMPGNGPCPALGSRGCMLKKCRPITCTTQICEKMLMVLNRLGVVRCGTSRPLQVEEVVIAPDILPELFGTRKRKKISEEEVRRYKEAVIELRKKFLAINEKDRLLAIEESLSYYFGKENR